jgi:hypothetical protein
VAVLPLAITPVALASALAAAGAPGRAAAGGVVVVVVALALAAALAVAGVLAAPGFRPCSGERERAAAPRGALRYSSRSAPAWPCPAAP